MSYEYLEKDVIPVKLCKEVGRIKENIVPLSPGEEERALRIHRQALVVDFHVHFTMLPENLDHYETWVRSGRPPCAYEGVKRSGLTGCLLGFGGNMGRRSSPVPWRFEDIVWDLGMRRADMDHHRDIISRALFTEDILEAKKNNRTAVIAHIESTQMIENDLDRLDVLYGLGVRCLGLTYNTRTDVGDGCGERTDSGLSSFGLKVVERMNRLGMLIDLAHSAPLTSTEAIEASTAPCCITHAFPRAVYDHPRGVPDSVLELLVKKGGIIGVEAVPNITSFKEKQTVFDVIEHVDYLVKRFGIDHVAIGTDTMFGDHVAFHKHMMKVTSLSSLIHRFPAEYIDFIENPGQWPNVTRALVARGYSDEQIEKLIGGNVLRILKQTIG